MFLILGEQDIPEEAHNSKIWLKVNSEPKEQVLYHWEISYPLRIKREGTITQFFHEWPILETQLAPELVSSINSKYLFEISLYFFYSSIWISKGNFSMKTLIWIIRLTHYSKMFIPKGEI